MYWPSSRVGCTNHCLASQCDTGEIQKENLSGDNQGQRSLIEVSGISAGAQAKSQKHPALSRPLNLFNQSCVKGQDQHCDQLCYAMASIVSPSHPGANKYCQEGEKENNAFSHPFIHLGGEHENQSAGEQISVNRSL